MTKPVTFGYLHDFRNPAQFRRPWDAYYGEILDFFTHIEGLGFEGAWVPEHHCAEDGYTPSPIVALTAIAARTKTLKVRAGVSLAPFYHPVRFAEDCAVLDILSGGRVEMSVALGYRQIETDAYGLDFKTRAKRTDEFLEIVRRLWAGERFSYEGKHFQLTNASIMPLPLQGKIPLLIGALADKGLDRVVKYGDGYFGNIDLCGQYMDKLKADGKDPAGARMLVGNLFFAVAEDVEKAKAELSPYLYHVNSMYGIWLNEQQYRSRINADEVPQSMSLEQFQNSMLQIKTPDEAIAHIRGMQAKAPIEHMMMMVPPGLPPHRFVPYAETFARKVMPAFS